jgi:uncharacterized membrane protein YhaH (DUF805 family)
MDLMKLLFNFDGRIRRTHYWLASIGLAVAANVLISLIAAVTGMGNIFLMHAEGAPAFGPSLLVAAPLVIVVFAVAIWASLALQVKRWHDRDKSWFWVFIAFIPLVGGLWVLVECGFLDGTQGPNRFGPSPKGIGAAS